MLKDLIQKLVEGKNLSGEEITGAMSFIMEGNATQAQIGSFITALRMKGETIEEITGCARVLREKADVIKPQAGYYIDTCGTGGDGTNSFNISTASAFVAAAGGVHVAKHGNRSVSSRSGSADVLEALGVKIALEPEQVRQCVDNVGIGFIFAQAFHKSMKHAAGPRRELGIRTVFNIIGPLSNPANAKGQLMGVFDEDLTEPLANVLKNLDVERGLVVHGLDGMDEITTICGTKVSELKDGKVKNYEISPEKFGIERVAKEELKGGDSSENAEIIKAVFRGMIGAKRDVVLMNSAAALYVGKAAESLGEGIEKAKRLIDSGSAMGKLEELIQYTNRF